MAYIIAIVIAMVGWLWLLLECLAWWLGLISCESIPLLSATPD
jgi:hypothetical protein